jgi:hypothetical protein
VRNRANRSKISRIVASACASRSAFTRNEALLLLNELACQVLHIAQTALETAGGEGISLHWLRCDMLVIGTRAVIGSWHMKVVIENRFADLRSAVIHRLYSRRWTPPSSQ